MKYLEIRRIAGNALPSLTLATDSSIAVNGKPVFLPDFSSRWELRLYPAYRISRLGKTISERFAPRYYDAVTLAARLIPLDLVDRLRVQGESLSPLAMAFDGAIALGKWLPLPDDASDLQVSSSAGACKPIRSKIINSEIEYLSRGFILKNGDVIACGDPLLVAPVNIDTGFEASIGDSVALSFNIK